MYFSGLNKTQKIDQVLCVEELKLQLLAKSSICPGIITIIWSLITSDTGRHCAENINFEVDENIIEILNHKAKLEPYISMAKEKSGQDQKNNHNNKKDKNLDMNMNSQNFQ